MKLHLHLCVLFRLHFIYNLLFLRLKWFNLFLIIPHHLFLLMLHFKNVFLECLKLLLQLLLKWFKVIHLLLWRSRHILGKLLLIFMIIVIHLRVWIWSYLRLFFKVNLSMINLYFATLLFIEIMIVLIMLRILLKLWVLSSQLSLIFMILIVLLLVLIVVMIVLKLTLPLSVLICIHLLLLLWWRRLFIRIDLTLVSFIKLFHLFLDTHLFPLIL